MIPEEGDSLSIQRSIVLQSHMVDASPGACLTTPSCQEFAQTTLFHVRSMSSGDRDEPKDVNMVAEQCDDCGERTDLMKKEWCEW